MTTDDLDVKAILERAEAATPGPWVKTRQEGAGGYVWVDTRADVPEGEACILEMQNTVRDEADAAFIAAARADVPALCAEVERLRGELEDIRSASRRLVAAADEGQRLAVDRLIDTNLPLRNELAASAEALRIARVQIRTLLDSLGDERADNERLRAALATIGACAQVAYHRGGADAMAESLADLQELVDKALAPTPTGDKEHE